MDELLTALRAAGEPTRLRILATLASGELAVSELTQVLLQSQPRISRHLKLLADAGLVRRHPEGSWVFYRLEDSGGSAQMVSQLLAALPGDDHVLLRDKERLAQVRAERAARAQAYFATNAAGWDELRARHIPETQVEAAMADLIGDGENPSLLVDLGTGTGRMLEVFAGRAVRAIGFDISADMLTIARDKIDRAGLDNCQVRQGDCANVPLADGEAELVVMHQVLHFLDDPQAALAEAERITAPGGQILIADFLPHDLEFLRDEHAHRRLGFADADMEKWLSRLGLTSGSSRHLPAADNDLTVALWTAQKPISGQNNGARKGQSKARERN